MIEGFEQRRSLLRQTVTTEFYREDGGNSVVFLVEDSGAATAVTRGVDGLIPTRNQSKTQTTITLTEWHDLPRQTRFNIWASQNARARQTMQNDSLGVINRKIDQDIIDVLAGGTINTGTAAAGSVSQFMHAQALLGAADVPWDGKITLLCSVGYLGFLQQAPEFSSADFVKMSPFAGEGGDWRDQPQVYRWRNVMIIPHPILTLNTSAEKAYLYHMNSVGHAADMPNANIGAGYNQEQDYSWSRTSCFMGSARIQNTGIVVINHDASSLAAG